MPRKSKQLEKEYSGHLKQPIILPSDLPTTGRFFESNTGLLADMYERENIPRITAEMHDKFDLLFEHYGISNTSDHRWYLLALKLAINHVPGFQVVTEKRGRKIKWDPVALAHLYFEVEDRLQTSEYKNPTVQWACSELSRTPTWKAFFGPRGDTDQNAKTLQNNYILAKTSLLVEGYLKMKSDEILSAELIKQFELLVAEELQSRLKVSRK